MACCLIALEVYEKMKYPYYRFLLKEKRLPDGELKRYWLAEDLYFCMKAEDLGYEVYVDTGLKTRHIGGYGVGEDTYLAYKDGFKHVIKTIDQLGLDMDQSTKRPAFMDKEAMEKLVKDAEAADKVNR